MSDFAYSLLAFVVNALSFIYLLTESAIFAPYRVLMANTPYTLILAYCRTCTGFWVGVAMGWHEWTWLGHPTRPLFTGFLVMLMGYVWTLFVPNHAWDTERGDDDAFSGPERLRESDT